MGFSIGFAVNLPRELEYYFVAMIKIPVSFFSNFGNFVSFGRQPK